MLSLVVLPNWILCEDRLKKTQSYFTELQGIYTHTVSINLCLTFVPNFKGNYLCSTHKNAATCVRNFAGLGVFHSVSYFRLKC